MPNFASSFMIRTLFVSVVPSPYQRDLLGVLARRPELELSVCYLEAASPDSPWPEESLRDFERVLPGWWFGFGPGRFHFNSGLPPVDSFDIVILNTLYSWVTQRLTRSILRKKAWIFWGERLRQQSRSGRKLIQAALARPLCGSSAIAAIGTVAQQDYRERFPGKDVRSIPYYCDLQPFIETKRESKGPINFLFCGQMIQRKGVDVLLAAFDQVVQENPNVKLTLVGRQAELPTFLSSVSHQARTRISYEGFQPPEQLPRFFAQADVFILPSRYDGWGVVVNQALGAGLPVLCSDAVGAAHDLVSPETNGALFPSGDAEALSRHMKRLAVDRDKVLAWGSASRARAENWMPERGAAKWVETIETVLARA